MILKRSMISFIYLSARVYQVALVAYQDYKIRANFTRNVDCSTGFCNAFLNSGTDTNIISRILGIYVIVYLVRPI